MDGGGPTAVFRMNHLRLYVGSDPINYTDPSGQFRLLSVVNSTLTNFIGLGKSVAAADAAASGGALGQLFTAGRIATYIACKIYAIARAAEWAAQGFQLKQFPSFVPYSDSLPDWYPSWGEPGMNLFCISRMKF